MRKKIVSLLFAACMLLAAPVCMAEEYNMKAGDNVQIQVMGHEDLSSTYVARTDGKFEYPLIGTVDVTGKTVEGLTQELKERLAEYIVNPLITVNITKMGQIIALAFRLLICTLISILGYWLAYHRTEQYKEAKQWVLRRMGGWK